MRLVRLNLASIALSWALLGNLCGTPSAVSAMTANTLAHDLSTLSVGTSVQPGKPGVDSGLTLQSGEFVRVAASGAISLFNGPCGHGIGPYGCATPPATPTAGSTLGTGTLAAIFTNANYQPVSTWQAVGEYGLFRVPVGAEKMFFSVYNLHQRGYGHFSVVSDLLPDDPALRGAMGRRFLGAGLRGLQSTRSAPDPTGASPVGSSALGTSRSDIQHVLRRLGFSDTPEDISAIQQSGGAAVWIQQQIAPGSINDSAAAPYVFSFPSVLNQTFIGEGGYSSANIFHNRNMQLEVNSKKQLLEKMTLLWLEHFSVSDTAVNVYDYEFNDQMSLYQETLRNDALGNFQNLLADATETGAVQIWLNELGANGAGTAMPPNENFAREIMQLYSMGPSQLNADGTTVLDGNGQPVAQYSEADVKQAALLLTGWLLGPHNDGTWPNYASPLIWTPALHPTKTSYSIMGQTIADPGGNQCVWNVNSSPFVTGPCVYTNFVSMLAHQPTTWAYMSKELIERLAEENPSPAYVARITQVWGANVNAPNQIALVVKAIATDPEFYNAKYKLVKEPVEYVADAIRALHGAYQSSIANSGTTGNGGYPAQSDATNILGNMGEDYWFPPNVFGFYPPGDKEALLNNNTDVLGRWGLYATNGVALTFAPGSFSNSCGGETACTSLMNLQFLQNASASTITSYLLDALVDGGDAELHAVVLNYLQNNSSTPAGAVWIILLSPEYEVN